MVLAGQLTGAAAHAGFGIVIKVKFHIFASSARRCFAEVAAFCIGNVAFDLLRPRFIPLRAELLVGDHARGRLAEAVEVQNVPAVLAADGRHVALCSRLVKRPVEHVLGNGEDRRVVVGDGGNFPVVGAVIILVPDIVAQLKERLRRAVALGKRVEIVPNVVVRVRSRNGEVFEVDGRIIVVAFLAEEGDIVAVEASAIVVSP